MEIIGWIVLGWFAVAFIVSYVFGGFLRHAGASVTEEDLAESISTQQVLRYMRTRKPKATTAPTAGRLPGKRSTG